MPPKSNKKIIVIGDEKIDRLLRDLPRSVGNKVLKKAMRKGLKPVLSRARSLAPVASGELKRSTKIYAGKRTRSTVRLSVLSDARDEHGFFYSVLQDYGSEVRGIPATAFMRRAYWEKADDARSITVAEILRELDALVKKGG